MFSPTAVKIQNLHSLNCSASIETMAIESSDEFKWAVKVVIKRQMRHLMEQLRDSGEEVAILSVNLDDNTCSHFGSPTAEWFIMEQKDLTTSFLNFCKNKAKRGASKCAESVEVNPKLSNNKQMMSKPMVVSATQKIAASQDGPMVNVSVPKQMCGDASEEEIAGLVGRIIASHKMVNKEKGTVFESLLKALQLKKMRDKQGPPSKKGRPETSPIRATRSGRKMSAKYLEGINSLKRNIKREDITEDDVEEDKDIGAVGTLVDLLMDLDVAALKKVQVRLSGGRMIDVQRTILVAVDQLEVLAAILIPELKAIASAGCVDKKHVTVIVDVNDSDKVTVEMSDHQSGAAKVKNEEMDDSDMEYIDFKGDDDEEEDEDDEDAVNDGKGSDVDYIPNIRLTAATPKEAIGMSDKPSPASRRLSGLKRKLKKRCHTETMLVNCDQCGVQVTGKSNLKSHIRRVHLKVKNYKCNICGKGFWSNNARESHMLSVHTRRCDACQEYVVESVPWASGVDMRQKRDVICTCGAIVSIYSIFGRRRQYLHDDEPDEEGNYGTPSRPKSHSGTKYACGTCGKLFMKKSNCERHSRAHTDYKGCVCNLCGSSFAYESSLKKHMHSEHGIARFVCGICGNNYSNDTALKVHYVKAHTQTDISVGDSVGNLKFACDICGDHFSNHTALKTHYVKSHSQASISVGENVAVIVKDRSVGNDTTDLEEQMEEIMEGEDEVEVENGEVNRQGAEDSHGVQHMVVTSEGQSLSGEGQIVVSHGEQGQTIAHEITAQELQQVLHEGHVIAREGNMSIIIKQLPM